MRDFQQELKAALPGIMSNPGFYVHTLDMQKGQALVVAADPAFYREALFLDQRVLQDNPNGAWVPLQTLFLLAMEGERSPPANFLFHTGHAGSTLISRLLDEVPGVLGLREPLPLRTMAAGYNIRDNMPDGAFEGALKPVYRLLARRYSPEQQVVIKATSICNNIGPLLMSQNAANKALLLYVTLETFLANMLDKKEAPDIDGFLDHRIAGFRELVPDFELEKSGLTRPQAMAFSWLVEAAFLANLSKGEAGPRSLLMDFDKFLAQRDIHLGMIFNHFGLQGGDEALGRALASPVFGGYAKKPDFPYTPENRAAILAESKSTNAAEIAEGIAFAEDLIEAHKELAGLGQTIALTA